MYGFAAGVVALLVTLTSGCANDLRQTVTEKVPVECQEDEPCWDCETMGNRICGPLPQQ